MARATIKTNIENGYSGKVSVGDSIRPKLATWSDLPTRAFQYRISMGQNQFSTGTFQNHDLNDPRVMLIPIVDFSNVNGNSQVPMKGFAMMWIVSVDGQGTITCYFIQQSVPNAQPDPTGTAALAPRRRYSNEVAQPVAGDQSHAGLLHERQTMTVGLHKQIEALQDKTWGADEQRPRPSRYGVQTMEACEDSCTPAAGPSRRPYLANLA